MSNPASLENLFDIIMPPPAPWWPPAPGWYVVFSLLILCLFVLLIRAGLRYRRNAYRRAALAEIQTAGDDADGLSLIAALLKRTALAAYPREQVASLTGKDWVRWLSDTGRIVVPEAVTVALVKGVYGGGPFTDTKALKDFAALWIQRHKGAP